LIEEKNVGGAKVLSGSFWQATYQHQWGFFQIESLTALFTSDDVNFRTQIFSCVAAIATGDVIPWDQLDDEEPVDDDPERDGSKTEMGQIIVTEGVTDAVGCLLRLLLTKDSTSCAPPMTTEPAATAIKRDHPSRAISRIRRRVRLATWTPSPQSSKTTAPIRAYPRPHTQPRHPTQTL